MPAPHLRRDGPRRRICSGPTSPGSRPGSTCARGHEQVAGDAEGGVRRDAAIPSDPPHSRPSTPARTAHGYACVAACPTIWADRTRPGLDRRHRSRPRPRATGSASPGRRRCRVGRAETVDVFCHADDERRGDVRMGDEVGQRAPDARRVALGPAGRLAHDAHRAVDPVRDARRGEVGRRAHGHHVARGCERRSGRRRAGSRSGAAITSSARAGAGRSRAARAARRPSAGPSNEVRTCCQTVAALRSGSPAPSMLVVVRRGRRRGPESLVTAITGSTAGRSAPPRPGPGHDDLAPERRQLRDGAATPPAGGGTTRRAPTLSTSAASASANGASASSSATTSSSGGLDAFLARELVAQLHDAPAAPGDRHGTAAGGRMESTSTRCPLASMRAASRSALVRLERGRPRARRRRSGSRRCR